MRNVTPIPNTLFDKYLAQLKPSDTIVLLTIFRFTNGWIDPNTGQRKKRDWISNSLFETKTSLSSKTISQAISNLVDLRLIKASDYLGNELSTPESRRGKTRIYYGPYYKSKGECVS